jgi:hypothetical protein
VQHAGRSMQAGAALAPRVSQQAFKHAVGSWVAGVIPARITPSIKIPIDGAGFRDYVRNSYQLLGRPVCVKRARGFWILGFVIVAIK